MKRTTTTKARGSRTPPHLSKERLAAMIEEATVDAYDEEEQATGWFTMFEEHVELPFETKVLGEAVTAGPRTKSPGVGQSAAFLASGGLGNREIRSRGLLFGLALGRGKPESARDAVWVRSCEAHWCQAAQGSLGRECSGSSTARATGR